MMLYLYKNALCNGYNSFLNSCWVFCSPAILTLVVSAHAHADAMLKKKVISQMKVQYLSAI